MEALTDASLSRTCNNHDLCVALALLLQNKTCREVAAGVVAVALVALVVAVVPAVAVVLEVAVAVLDVAVLEAAVLAVEREEVAVP